MHIDSIVKVPLVLLGAALHAGSLEYVDDNVWNRVPVAVKIDRDPAINEFGNARASLVGRRLYRICTSSASICDRAFRHLAQHSMAVCALAYFRATEASFRSLKNSKSGSREINR
jgi:hypothetical protein